MNQRVYIKCVIKASPAIINPAFFSLGPLFTPHFINVQSVVSSWCGCNVLYLCRKGAVLPNTVRHIFHWFRCFSCLPGKDPRERTQAGNSHEKLSLLREVGRKKGLFIVISIHTFLILLLLLLLHRDKSAFNTDKVQLWGLDLGYFHLEILHFSSDKTSWCQL